NNLAAVLLPALALCGFLALAARGRAERCVLAVCGAVLVAGLLLTQSRGGLVGLVAMAVAAAVLSGPVRRSAIALVLATVVAGIAYFAVAAPSAREHVTSF